MLRSQGQIHLFVIFAMLALLLAGCVEEGVAPAGTPTAPAAATIAADLPLVYGVFADRRELPRYESLEMIVELEAAYDNPFDARQVRLEATFSAPDGTTMLVPGFWDADAEWRLRFTPSQAGQWTYEVVVSDVHGTSVPFGGSLSVTESDHHGWLQPGDRVNPDFSGHYLVYHDGTPFYGLGHADALNILIDGFSVDRGVGLFNDMVAAGENYVVWWPLYSQSPLSSYDDYNAASLATIDLVVADAQAKGIFLIFTIWDHPQLRDDTHAWGTGNWARNGFSDLVSLADFFTDGEAWAWQENFYRYTIARWGYSPAIGMWQTVSEINGTNAYDQADPWHERVNAYFVAHDPYRHPTTASQSGDVDWAAGHLAMDAPQVHIYDFAGDDPIQAAAIVAGWTQTMWDRVERPNWIGEFGVSGNQAYPELYHNSIWAAMAAGAAMTPAEWNSGGSWGRMTPEMLADLGRLGEFVADFPFARMGEPAALVIESSDPAVRAWGVAGGGGGVLWVQDFALEGSDMATIRADETVRSDVVLRVNGLPPSPSFAIEPYDTWQGVWLDNYVVTCPSTGACEIPLPPFRADLALRLKVAVE